MAAELVTRAARATPPGAFAVTMATGIVSAAVRAAGAPGLALALLALAALSFAVTTALTAVRAARFGCELRADLRDPAVAFTAFTLVAACDVLAGDLTQAAARDVAVLAVTVLTVAGLAAWAILTVTVPGRLAARPRAVPARAVGGTWYLWVVAIQSLVIVACDLGAARPGPWHAAALAGWCAGAAGYLAVSGLVAARLATAGLRNADPTAPYWVAMGAASITVLAAASLIAAPGITHPGRVLAGPAAGRAAASSAAGALGWLGTAFWILATCLILPLAVRSLLRHLRWREPLRYRGDLWMIVFPAGMYATASMRLGAAARFAIIVQAGRAAAWPALAAWAVLAAALAVVLARQANPRPGLPARSRRRSVTSPPGAR